ncbi:restriction endonuclease [Verrucomicrobia bacterium S94]|nr:restriction endonuclease [Verrucomicrobia bacterium S94]
MLFLTCQLYSKKKQRLVCVDDYGVPYKDEWFKELEYFYQQLLQNELNDLEIQAIASLANYRLFTGERTFFDNGYAIEEEQIHQGLLSVLDGVVDVQTNYEEESTSEYSDDITPEEYEYFVTDILNDNGWVAVVTQGSGDQGIDIVAEKDDFRLAIQCEKYSKPVGNKAVQEAYAGEAFYEANACAVVAPPVCN